MKWLEIIVVIEIRSANEIARPALISTFELRIFINTLHLNEIRKEMIRDPGQTVKQIEQMRQILS